jgi:hypothetical protein
MRVIFEAALPVVKECDWSEAKDSKSLVAVLSKAFGRRG